MKYFTYNYFFLLSFLVMASMYTYKVLTFTPQSYKIEIYSYHTNPVPQPVDIEAPSLTCLTEALYFEARGEDKVGMLAVADVILNRASNKHFPSTICKVINQPYQFSYTLEPVLSYSDSKSKQIAKELARQALSNDYSVSTQALYYFNPKKLSKDPSWASDKYFLITIGNHKFYSWHKNKS